MREVVVAVVSLAFALGASAAEFEGRAEYRVKGGGQGPAQDGNAVVYISPKGSRSEIEISPSPELAAQGMTRPMRMVAIAKASEPGRVYLVNDASKTYSVGESTAATPVKWTVERAGSDKVAGFACERARLTGSGGERFDVCITRDLGTVAAWAASGGSADAELPRALKKAGLDGLPARWSVVDTKAGGAVQMTMELVRAERQKVPPAKLEVPAGYTKSAMPGVTPEMQRKMQEMMKDLPPEQRKQMEEMMRRGGGAPPAGG